jgi:hypothetical protein
VYSRDVVFIEFRRNSKFEVVQTYNNPKKVRFQLRNEEEYYLDESNESDEDAEQPILVIRALNE